MKKILAAAMLIMLTACTRKTPLKAEQMHGTWIRESGSCTAEWVFEIDGTYREKVTEAEEDFEMNDTGRYEVEDGKLVVKYDTYGSQAEYTVDIEDDTMTWTAGDTRMVFKKKK